MRALFAALLLCSVICGTGSSVSYARGEATLARDPFGAAAATARFLPVEQAYQLAVDIQENGSLRLYWQIAERYYLYRHRLSFTLEDAAGPIELAADLPPALERSDEYFGQTQVYYDSADITLEPRSQPQQAVLTVTSQGCADAGLCYPPRTQYFSLDFAAGTALPIDPPGARNRVGETRATRSADRSLLYMALLAFAGGAILNLMPCVFPILSLKVLSFARSSDHDRHLHGWVYAAGVVASFVLAAALLAALQQAGRAVGWGFQLQSPGFVIALAYLFVAMGLSLSGLIQLGGKVMNTGSTLVERGGFSGSFFTGVLAVVVASPCTAPFMGTALGFALTQSVPVGLLIFAALGAGMAAPLLLLSYSTTARRLLPRPGPWMETLKQLLAFPLYATAIWLLWVAGRQTGVNTMGAALLGVLVLALGLWLWRFAGWQRLLAVICLLGAAALGSWRTLDDARETSPALAAGRVAWSAERLAQLRGAGQAVFVDVTADWCITCIANEKAVLHTSEVAQAFAARDVVYMVADWTNYDAAIAGFLEQHGRTGIPLYVMYPADPNREPLVLPQLLTKDTVLHALSAAAPDSAPGIVSVDGASAWADRRW
ncbi:MAG: protein-disulfide reductase DsbD [Halioglobus sp.]|nr:protein-disulfide reductase DsbD [Halioglobus sp.]